MTALAKIALPLACLLTVTLAVLAARPDLDVAAAGGFYVGSGHFVGNTRAGIAVRYAAWALPFVIYAGLLLAAGCAKASLISQRFAPSGRNLLFLTLSLAIGPGLIVHTTLKEISHRPRPISIAEFGGPDAFRPFFAFDGACAHNCAFPSGEAAVATWMLAPASLAPPPWQGPALAGAILLAAATGLWRMALGAHFLSDICGAALIIVLVILSVRTILAREDIT